MGKYKKGEIFKEGKTKRFYMVVGDGRFLIVESKDDITKNDNPTETRQMDKKAKYSTATACMVFELLKKAGIPVGYERQLSETEFLAVNCEMIPLEVVERRYAVESYLKRYPNLDKGKEVPHRFHRLMFELFLKTTHGKIIMKNGEKVNMPNDADSKIPINDPLITISSSGLWELKHPKHPDWDAKANLDILIYSRHIFPAGVTIEEIEEITRKTFLVLEGAWAQLGFRLVDFKIEFGIDKDGKLLVADVIDNDSWRLRTNDWKELSKQLFRDNFDMKEIGEKYELVSKLVERFTVPKQALLALRGSESDKLPEHPLVSGIENIELVISGHKSPGMCLNGLETVLANYPEGGVILAIVGMSNGLGPILAARTSWPVIGVTATVETHPEDVWSSLRMPSNVPMMTMLSSKNAVLAALNILAQKNPIAYMHRQYEIEKLDI